MGGWMIGVASVVEYGEQGLGKQVSERIGGRAVFAYIRGGDVVKGRRWVR